MTRKIAKLKLPAVKFDQRGVQEADDGNTTYYGGTYKVDGVEYQAHGNDRGHNYTDDAVDKIVAAAKVTRPDLDVDRGSVVEAVADALPKRITTIKFKLLDGDQIVAVVTG